MKKGLLIVFCANVLNLIFSIVTSFILPKYLSIESYGYYKIYQMYTTYLGVAHLGFCDGIYLRYGGRDIRKIDKMELEISTSTIRNLQLLITVLLLICGFLSRNAIAIFLALSCLPINMISYYKNLYQATGEFKKYGTILSFLPFITFVCNIILIFILKSDNYAHYIIVVLCANLSVYIFLERKYYKSVDKPHFFQFDNNILVSNIKAGITLTIGNIASLLITSIDRWYIQALLLVSDFSYYSFAVSVDNIFNVCVSAVTTTLYNYLCRTKDTEEIKRIKSYCVYTGIYLIAIAFPVKFIVGMWLRKYVPSISCMFILISAHSLYFVIKAIYINLYKARNMQSHYMKQMILVLVIASCLNAIGYFFVSKTKEIFAVATLTTAMIWFSICHYEFDELKKDMKENLCLVLSIALFLFLGLCVCNPIIGLLEYIIGVSLILIILNRNNFLCYIKEILKMGSKIASRWRTR